MADSLILPKKILFNGNVNHEIEILETIEADYGWYVWPCSVVMAAFINFHRNLFNGKNIIEIGAGTALPSILIAKSTKFSSLTITDKSCTEKYTSTLEKSFKRNLLSDAARSKMQVAPLRWGSIPLWLPRQRPAADIIIASDCFYDEGDFEDVLSTICLLLRQRGEGGVCYCTYQNRTPDWSIVHQLKQWRLQCEIIPLAMFGADCDDIGGSKMPGSHSIEMYRITLAVGENSP